MVYSARGATSTELALVAGFCEEAMTTAGAIGGSEGAAGLPARGGWRRVVNLANGVTAVFAVVCAVFIFRHVLWIDEAQAFVIARDSPNPAALLNNLRYEGHPPLWHLLLWVVTRFTVSYHGMQALHWAMATGSVYLVARFAPFPWAARVLFAFGYFPLFEYGVISRNYQLVLLLTMGFCALWMVRRRAFVWLGVILALLTLSHVMGVIIGAALGMMLLLDAVVTKAGREAIGRRPWRFLAGVLIAAGGAGLSCYLMKPPADDGYARVSVVREVMVGGERVTSVVDAEWYWAWDADRAQRALTSLWDGLMPMPSLYVETDSRGRPVKRTARDDVLRLAGWDGGRGTDTVALQGHFWDSNMIDSSPAATWHGSELACGVLLLVGAFCLSWRGAIFYVIATGGLLAFCYVKFQGGVRHHGGLYISLVAAFWIAWGARGAAVALPRWRRMLEWVPRGALVGYLAVQVYAGAIACFFAWQVPFATGGAAGEALAKAVGPDDLIVADEFVAPTLSIYVPGRTFYLPVVGVSRNFIVWRKRDQWTASTLDQAQNVADRQQKTVIWITRYQPPEVAEGVTLVGRFDGGGRSLADSKAIMPMEYFNVYRVLPQGAVGTRGAP